MKKDCIYQTLVMIVCLVMPCMAFAVVDIHQQLLGINGKVKKQESENTDKKISEPEVNAEVLVFVDVSGSMKQNDPLNMRAPAIRLLSGMAPSSANVGIYLFGTSVRELVPMGTVSEEWKKLAEYRSEQFQSRDLYTNIESALLSAKSKWQYDKDVNRSIILLTDGIVDIDKNPIVSIASRDRIIDRVIGSLQEQNINVHTIALSENADHRLLQEISVATDGKYQQVGDAERLQRTFMSLFEQSAPQDTIPLQGNKITVDNSISELTLLVFRKPDADPTQLASPQGVIYEQSSTQEFINWQHDKGYDLISIQNPEAGTWQLIADEDPDNRAMVVTDLKLKTTDLPNVVLNGETLQLDLWMENNGEKISRPEFLKLINSKMVITSSTGEGMIRILDPPSVDGVISVTSGPDWLSGEQELLVQIASDTFFREKRFSINAYASPIEVVSEQVSADENFEPMDATIDSESSNTPTWNVMINVLPGLIDIEKSKLQVTVTSQDKQQQTVDVQATNTGWQFHYRPTHPGQSLVNIELSSVSPSGREILIQHPELKLGEWYEEKTMPVIEEIEAEQEVIEQPSIPTLIQVIIPVVIGNILYLILYIGWRFFKRMRDATYLHPEEVL